jgi:hypothetical protein
MQSEPTLEQIEDYNGNESSQKRKTINLVILFCIVVSIAYAVIKFNYNSVDDYVGTPDKPGINTAKN